MSKITPQTICIYHRNCADGYTGAWVVKEAHPNEEIEFFGGSYGKEFPHVVDKDVILVDFSYKRDQMIAMSKVANTIIILDHHASAQDDLIDLQEECECPVTVIFDMERSGCRIAWDFYFPGRTPPQMLLHVEDRDLWKFKLDGTKELMALMFSYEQTFDCWDILMDGDFGMSEAMLRGEAIVRNQNKNIKDLAPMLTQYMTIAGYKNIPTINVPYFMASDMGHYLCKDALFAVMWYRDKDGVYHVSFRSDGKVNVFKIAELHGGGGHKNASGCKIKDITELDCVI